MTEEVKKDVEKLDWRDFLQWRVDKIWDSLGRPRHFKVALLFDYVKPNIRVLSCDNMDTIDLDAEDAEPEQTLSAEKIKNPLVG